MEHVEVLERHGEHVRQLQLAQASKVGWLLAAVDAGLVGEDGTVEKAMYNVKATGHVAKLRRELGI